jgi:sugar lactone lactonase YvrE
MMRAPERRVPAIGSRDRLRGDHDMTRETARYAAASPPRAAAGWRLERLTPPSRVFGANGLRTGPDGRLYVAQVTGSAISAIDLASGALETVSPLGGDIVAPDDVAFDARGNLYATEVMDGRVSVLGLDRRARVLRGELPCANGITVHRGRLFVGECRMGGRILELDLAGAAPRLLLEDVPMPNAMEVGPDGQLYFPVMGANEIWRVPLAGGKAECVARDLGVPDAVKFDAQGFIVSTQAHSGEVLRIDPRSGERRVLAALEPGLDNLSIAGERLFVSHLTNGRITEILASGETRALLPGGLNWPLGLALGDDGLLYVADGVASYALRADGALESIGMLFTPGYPGFVRGIAASGPGRFAVTTSNGEVASFRPWERESEVLASGLDQLYGIAVEPGGALVVAELGTGRVLRVRPGETQVLARDLREPLGVAIGADGRCFASEAGAGRVVELTRAGAQSILDGLQRPQGIALRGRELCVVDAGAKELVALDLDSRARRTLASGLPVGAPPGVVPKPLRGFPPFSGPQGPFAGLAAASDGALYLSADADGSLLALRPGRPNT